MEGSVVCSHFNKQLLWIWIGLPWPQWFCQNHRLWSYGMPHPSLCLATHHCFWSRNSIASAVWQRAQAHGIHWFSFLLLCRKEEWRKGQGIPCSHHPEATGTLAFWGLTYSISKVTAPRGAGKLPQGCSLCFRAIVPPILRTSRPGIRDWQCLTNSW